MVITMQTISEIKTAFLPVFEEYNVRKAVLFGSYAKGCAVEESDIDLLVDSGLGGFNFFGLYESLAERVSKKLELFDVSEIDKNSRVDNEIRATGLVIYEK
ncbi:MAG: nucleotidyltransferase domain-containing protein [Oscillospiraceae bacterium]|nr:nucleotidyltransferase domain-containing protein [Oscillospiraceae bacterium]